MYRYGHAIDQTRSKSFCPGSVAPPPAAVHEFDDVDLSRERACHRDRHLNFSCFPNVFRARRPEKTDARIRVGEYRVSASRRRDKRITDIIKYRLGLS